MAEEKAIHEDVSVNHNLSAQQSHGLHHDHVAEEALGGHSGDLPTGYFKSIGFIGTVIVR
jgi:hypothetical protein